MYARPSSRNHQRLPRPVLLCVFSLAAVSGVSPTSAQLPCVELSALSQSGGQLGSEFEVRVVAGNHLAEIDQLRFSDPRITAEVLTEDPLPLTREMLPRYGHFRIRIPAAVPKGLYEVRAIGRHGVSNPRAFLVSSLEDIVPPQISHRPGQPTPLLPNTRLHARATSAARDFCAVDLTAGQTVRVDLLAQRIDSRMIGQLVLYDRDGQVADAARGADDVDPWLIVTAEETRRYVVGIHDFLFRGGDEYFYQVCRADDATAKNVARPIVTNAEANMSDGRRPRWSHPSALTFVDQQDVPGDRASIEETAAPQPLTPPSRLIAAFDSPHDEDAFEFTAAKGDAWVVEIVSQRLDEPTDPHLCIERLEEPARGDPLWHPVVAQDDSQAIGDAAMRLWTRDPVARFEAPATTTYRLRVRDLDSGEWLASHQSYWLDVRHPAPDFALLAYQPAPIADAAQSRPVGSHLHRGGSEAIRVLAVRRDGWSAPIEVSVEGLPESVECRPAIIATNQDTTQLTLVASEDAPAWCGPIRIVGRGSFEGQQRLHAATPAAILWGPGGNREFVRSGLATEIVVSVSDRDLAPVSIQVGDASLANVKKGNTLTVPIQLDRREGGKGKCILRPRDLPPGATSADVTIEGDASKGQLELKVSAEAVPGDYSLWLQAETTVTIKPNPQALQRAGEYRAELQKQLDAATLTEDREKITAALKIADQRIEAAKPAGQDQQLTVFLPSPPVMIRIED